MSDNKSNSNSSQPSLVGGHAQYVKGLGEQAIGSVTGSQEWRESGAQDREAGVDAMKAAGAERDSAQQGLGSFEELAGRAVGCVGMEKEGAESKSS